MNFNSYIEYRKTLDKEKNKRVPRRVRDELYVKTKQVEVDRVKQEHREYLKCMRTHQYVKVVPVEFRRGKEYQVICKYGEFKIPVIIPEEEYIPDYIRGDSFSVDKYLETHLGGEIEVLITGVYKKYATASRVLAMKKRVRQHYFLAGYLTLYAENRIVPARVTGVLPHSLYVDVGGRETEIKKLEIAHTPQPHLSELYSIGDTVQVLILDLVRDEENKTISRINVSKRRAERKEFLEIYKQYKPEMSVIGKVIKNVDRGCIVYLDSGISIFAAISMSLPRPRLGQKVLVRITNCDDKKLHIYGVLRGRFTKNLN